MRRAILILALIAVAFTGWGFANARADPIVRRASIGLPEWPVGASPMQALLLSDLHVAGPDMPPARLRKIVALANALNPDLVLIAGDFVSDKRFATTRYPVAEAIAPLAALRPRLGVVAVLGNHDHWRDAAAFRRALPKAGVTVLDNRAERRDWLVLAGVDDDFTGHADAKAVADSIAMLDGPVVVLSHSPDIAPALPARASLVLAGHTHCGQIALPLIGRPATMSRYGERYACGVAHEPGRTVITGAGLGTSLVPLRFGAPPDMWLLTLGPARD